MAAVSQEIRMGFCWRGGYPTKKLVINKREHYCILQYLRVEISPDHKVTVVFQGNFFHENVHSGIIYKRKGNHTWSKKAHNGFFPMPQETLKTVKVWACFYSLEKKEKRDDAKEEMPSKVKSIDANRYAELPITLPDFLFLPEKKYQINLAYDLSASVDDDSIFRRPMKPVDYYDKRENEELLLETLLLKLEQAKKTMDAILKKEEEFAWAIEEECFIPDKRKKPTLQEIRILEATLAMKGHPQPAYPDPEYVDRLLYRPPVGPLSKAELDHLLQRAIKQKKAR